MKTLTKDLILDAARDRRRRRQARLAALGTLPIALVIILLFPSESSNPSQAITGPPPPAEEPAPELPYTSIRSEAELLALLEEQSPVLFTDEYGRRTLVLTNPN